MSPRRRLLLAVALGVAMAVAGLSLAGRGSGPSGGCPADGPERAVSLVPLVRLDGTTYALRGELPAGVRTDRLVGTTRCRVGTRTPSDHRLQDGDSTVLPPATPVLALAGVDPALAVTALVQGRPARFEALPGRDTATCGAGDPACAPLPAPPTG